MFIFSVTFSPHLIFSLHKWLNCIWIVTKLIPSSDKHGPKFQLFPPRADLETIPLQFDLIPTKICLWFMDYCVHASTVALGGHFWKTSTFYPTHLLLPTTMLQWFEDQHFWLTRKANGPEERQRRVCKGLKYIYFATCTKGNSKEMETTNETIMSSSPYFRLADNCKKLVLKLPPHSFAHILL